MLQLDHIYHGHVLDVLKALPDASVHCVVTSPPYWGLRDYGIQPQVWDGDPGCDHVWGNERIVPPVPDRSSSARDTFGNGVFVDHIPRGAQEAKSARGASYSTGKYCRSCGAWLGSFGLEPTPELYVSHAIRIFSEIFRVLKPTGTLWINIGDSYANDRKYGGKSGEKNYTSELGGYPRHKMAAGLKPKDMVGIPWRVAFALQESGWYLRQDIIWHKPTCMPESVKDRCTKAHEYIFLLSKAERYYFDQDAIKEPASPDTQPRYARGRSDHHKNADGGQGGQTIAKTFEHMAVKPGVNKKAVAGWMQGPGSHSAIDHNKPASGTGVGWGHLSEIDPSDARILRGRIKQNPSFAAAVKDVVEFRNKRSVWTVVSEPFPEAHFATFPQRLVQPMILAGTPPHGVVLDPFMGAGTTAVVAKKLDRHYIGIELNPDYIRMANKRLEKELGLLFAEEGQLNESMA